MEVDNHASVVVPQIKLRRLRMINGSAVFVGVCSLLALSPFAFFFASSLGPMDWIILAAVVFGGSIVAGWFALRRLQVRRRGSGHLEATYELFSEGPLRDLEISGFGLCGGLREIVVVYVRSPRGRFGTRINLRVTIYSGGLQKKGRRLNPRQGRGRLSWLNQPGELPIIRLELEKGEKREGSWSADIVIRGDSHPPVNLVARPFG